MFTSKIKVRSWLTITLAACATAIAFQSSTKAETKVDVSRFLVQASDTINQSLPMKIDTDTQWDSTFVGPGKMFGYNYTLLKYSAKQVDSKLFAQQFRPQVTNMLCKDPSSQVFRKNKVAMSVNVYDRSQVLISQIKVSPQECRITSLDKYSMF